MGCTTWIKNAQSCIGSVTCAKDLSLIEKNVINGCTSNEEKRLIWYALKRRFGLVVRLISNKCYSDAFYFLSFLLTTLRLPLLLPILAWSPYIVDHIFLVSFPTRTFACAANYLYYFNLGKHLMVSLLAYDGGACTAQPGLVAEKGEIAKNSLNICNWYIEWDCGRS